MNMIYKYIDLLFASSEANTNDKVVENKNANSLVKLTQKVVILSKVSIDDGAGGIRITNLVDLFSNSGNFFTSAYVFSKGKRFGDTISETTKNKYISLDDYSGFKGLKKYKKLFYNKSVIKKILDIEKPDIILIYSVLSFRNVAFVKRYARKHNIRLIFDVVEMRKLFSSFSPFAFFGYNLHNFLISHYFINKKTDGVICPTTYLKEYLCTVRKSKNVFLFPITMDVDSLPKFHKNRDIDKVTFLYAGNPSNKRDLIVNIIKGFNLLPKEYKEKLLLIVCGPKADYLINHEKLPVKEYEKSKEFTLYLGRLEKQKLYKMYPNIDFTLLLKNPKKRFSKAGFPTKMAESFACGVPMIGNFSGDMALYMKNNYNGYVCENTTPSSFKDAIKVAIDEYEQIHSTLSMNSLKTAKDKLENRNFYLDFADFLSSLL